MIEVTEVRGGAPESVHGVEGVVLDAHGRVLAATSRPDFPTFFRSSAKPFQMLPFVERGDFTEFTIPSLRIAARVHLDSDGESSAAGVEEKR